MRLRTAVTPATGFPVPASVKPLPMACSAHAHGRGRSRFAAATPRGKPLRHLLQHFDRDIIEPAHFRFCCRRAIGLGFRANGTRRSSDLLRFVVGPHRRSLQASRRNNGAEAGACRDTRSITA